jgi:hypothetical protein
MLSNLIDSYEKLIVVFHMSILLLVSSPVVSDLVFTTMLLWGVCAFYASLSVDRDPFMIPPRLWTYRTLLGCSIMFTLGISV